MTAVSRMLGQCPAAGRSGKAAADRPRSLTCTPRHRMCSASSASLDSFTTASLRPMMPTDAPCSPASAHACSAYRPPAEAGFFRASHAGVSVDGI